MTQLTLDKKEQQVKSYFDKVFMGYLYYDIKTLLNPKLDIKEKGGCAAPLAIIILSAMNQLGYLTSESIKKEIKSDNTEVCIKEFCKNWMAKVNSQYRKSTIQEIFVNFFRHGLAHQYLSMPNTFLTRDPNQKDLLSKIRNDDDKNYFMLQVCIFANDLLKALELLKNKIDKSKTTDPELIYRFYDRLTSLEKKYNKEELNKKVNRNLDIFYTFEVPSIPFVVSGSNAPLPKENNNYNQ